MMRNKSRCYSLIIMFFGFLFSAVNADDCDQLKEQINKIKISLMKEEYKHKVETSIVKIIDELRTKYQAPNFEKKLYEDTKFNISNIVPRLDSKQTQLDQKIDQFNRDNCI